MDFHVEPNIEADLSAANSAFRASIVLVGLPLDHHFS